MDHSWYNISETRVCRDRVISSDKKLVLPDIRGRVSYCTSLAASSQRDNNKNSTKGVILKVTVDSAFPNGESFNGWEKGKTFEGERMKRAASLSYFNARQAYLILIRGMRSLVRDEIDNYPALYALPLIRAIST